MYRLPKTEVDAYVTSISYLSEKVCNGGTFNDFVSYWALKHLIETMPPNDKFIYPKRLKMALEAVRCLEDAVLSNLQRIKQ